MATQSPAAFGPSPEVLAADAYDMPEQLSLWQDSWRRLRRPSIVPPPHSEGDGPEFPTRR